jgi:chemotaxis protein histidine kinase CheA
MNKGSFSEEAQATWDFVRCQREDGSFYGTSGKCRKGTEVAAKLAKVPKEKLQKLANHPKLTKEQKTQVQTAIKNADKGGAAPAAAKKETPAQLKKQYSELVKKQQELVKQGKIDEATKMSKEIGAAYKKWEDSSPKNQKVVEKKMAADKKAEKEKAGVTEKDLKAQNTKALQAFRKWKDAEDEGKSKEEVAKLKKKYQTEQQKVAVLKSKLESAKPKSAGDEIINKAAENFKERQAEYDRKAEAANLSSSQKAAINRYTAEDQSYSGNFGYRQLNECARNPSMCEDPKEAKKFTKQLDSAVAALPKNDNGDPFFRGIYVSDNDPTGQLYSALENATPGKRFRDPGFGSYTSNPGTAKDFGGTPGKKSIIFISRSKSLTPISPFSDLKEENEALLPRNTEQTIRKVTKDGQQLIVEVD